MKAALESQVLDDTWRWSTSIVAMTRRPLGTKGAPPMFKMLIIIFTGLLPQ
jgi:hypothetical protein